MNNSVKIQIGADHAGFEMKKKLIAFLESNNFKVKDFGTYTTDSVDYPDFAHPVAEAVLSEAGSLGILVCGSGNGVSITANKHRGIRAALCWMPELGMLARQHNNANILCLPSRFVTDETAIEIVISFLSASFEGGRHEKRENKIDC